MTDITHRPAQQATDRVRYGRTMRFGVLGPLEVTEKRRRLSTGGPKQRTVLALLIANAGNPVSTDALVQGVYGDDAPSGARRSVQTYVSNLRAELGDTIEATGNGYLLKATRDDVDALVFDDLVATASNGADAELRSTTLREALALWRGHPYADVDGSFVLTTEIGRLNELRAQAIEARVDADLELGRHRELVAELDSLTEEYPLRERFRAQQMLALYRSGRQAEALRAYERTRNYLVEEMGLDPSRELRDLEQRILEQDPSLAFETGPTVRHAAILVADVADPRMLSTLEPVDREALIQQQSEALEHATRASDGEVFAHRGSAMYASFSSVDAAVAASVAAQQALAEIRHPMRMGVSVGEVQVPNDGSVQGPPLTRAAQLVAIGHGGQVLLSPEANQALVDSGEAGWIVRSLGQHDVDGSGEQRAVYQLVIDGLPRDFPDLRSEMLPPPLPMDIRGLPGYELREQVGSGAFGVVHRAYQPSVGREVAVKIIRPEYANDPDFIRHFEVEAQLVARLEHPHIVPLHDYWRSPEGAYLVMRWLRGGTLQDRIAGGPLSIEQADALVDQIAPALAFAHRHGVVHRDLKPSNILLDEDGAPYLTDFGIARLEATTEVGSVAGDVRDLAGIVAMSLHGQTSNAAIAELLTNATGEDSPYGDVGSFVEAWNAAVGDVPAPDHAATYTPTRNPYKGLQAFGELDADDFYGRDAEIAEIIDTLRERRFVAVVGPSGIGKSSVTRAGAIPALRRGAIAGSENWLITDMMPGAYPFEELSAALMRVSVEPPRQLEEELRASDRGLARYVKRYLPEDATLLLVIDQFEELFTLTSDADNAAFLAMLAATAADERSNIRIVVTMRADFFDRPLRFADLGDALRDGTVPVAAPDRTAITEMVSRPAEGVGVTFESGLVERIAADAHDQAGALPLLEYALAELFAGRSTDHIDLDAYERTGGVTGALATRAEDIYTELEPEQQDAARQILLRLVRVSEGGQVTRRRVKLPELADLPAGQLTVQATIDAFAAHRLLTFDNDDTSRIPTIEVAHEAILRDWPRLAGWIADLTEDLVLHGRLRIAVGDWEASDANDTFLLTGGRLTQHESWTAETDLPLSSTEINFLTASRSAEDARRSKKRRTARLITAGFGFAAVVGLVLAGFALAARNDAQQQAQLAREKTAEAEQSAASAEAERENAVAAADAAERQRVTAQSNAYAASSAVAVQDDPSLAVMLALLSNETEASPTSLTALHRALQANRTLAAWEVPEGASPYGIADGTVTADGSLLALAGVGTMFEVIDTKTDDVLWSHAVLAQELQVVPLVFFEGGSRLLATETFIPAFEGSKIPPGLETAFVVFDSLTGEELRRFVLPDGCPPYGRFTHNRELSVGSSLLVVVKEDRTAGCNESRDAVGSLDLSSGELTTIAVATEGGLTLPDAEDLVSASTDGTIFAFGGNSGEVRHLDSDDALVEGLNGLAVLNSSGTMVATGYNTLRILDVASGEELAQFGAQGEFTRATFIHDDSTVLAGSRDGSVTAYEIDTGNELFRLKGHTGRIMAMTATSVGTVATFGADESARLWTLARQPSGATDNRLSASPAPYVFRGTTVNQTDLIVGVGSVPGKLTLWSGGTVEVTFDDMSLFAHAQSPDLSLVAFQPVTEQQDSAESQRFTVGALALYSAESGDRVRSLEGMCDWILDGQAWIAGPTCTSTNTAQGIYHIAFSPDGSMIAADALPMDDELRKSLFVWDTSTGELLFSRVHHDEVTNGAPVWTADSSQLISGYQNNIEVGLEVWDTSTWQSVARLTLDQMWHGRSLSSDGQRLFLADWGAQIDVIDTTTWEQLSEIQAHDGLVRSMVLDPTGSRLATGANDGSVKVWSTDTLALEQEIPLGDIDIVSVAFLDKDTLLIIPRFGVPMTVTISTAGLIEEARRNVFRSFTVEECLTFSIDPCPTLTDLQSP